MHNLALAGCREVLQKATRVLKQPGVLAVYRYGIPFFSSSQKATDAIMSFHTDTLSKVWHPNVRHIMNQYKEVELPYSVTERHDITQKWPIPLSRVVAFLRTLATYRKYMKEYLGYIIIALGFVTPVGSHID